MRRSLAAQLKRHVRRGWRPTGSARVAPALGVLATMGLCAVCGLVLMDLRDSVWLRAEQNAVNVLRVIEQDIARNFEVFDLSVRGVIDAIEDPTLREISPEHRQLVLFDRAATARYLGSILALDESGNVVADSRSTDARSANYATREYFVHHLQDPSSELYISHPFLSTRIGDPTVALSRRRVHSDGSFAGVVVGTMRLAYFEHLFQRLAIGDGGALNLFRADGTILMRYPGSDTGAIGRNIGESPTFQRLMQERSGSFVGDSAYDGVKRFYTFSHVGDLPLVLNIALSVDDILADWRQKAMLIGLVVLGLGGVTATLTVLLQRELRWRERAESRVLATNVELAELASTDALTGLLNRRQFDVDFGRAWGSAARMQSAVGVLMIDADNFKSYNDLYGHLAGDAALRAIGAALKSGLRRGSDRAYRIGGEEFAILLPDSASEDVLAVANRVLALLRELGIPHAGNSPRIVTASIGAAAGVPAPGSDDGEFLASADAALYGAKWGGRNQVMTATNFDLAPPRMAA